MQMLKDSKLIDNTWHYVADDETLITGDILISVQRWQQFKTDLLTRNAGHLGIRLYASDDVSCIADALPHVQLIELVITDFTDGRSFSQAWLLRHRYQFLGEIRASGDYLSDQVCYLARVGVNAFVPNTPQHLTKEINFLNDFSVHYQ
ncbi:MAG: DUF934 domain-containing protein [Methylovulum sp.]|jgi:uncharacterized protein (DUF934 family)|nr:DUF934 domain-containing protein [Methylovulum sp.]